MEKKSPAILIVDDDVNLASNLQDILEAAGYSVAVAPDAATALNLSRKKTFELGLIDVKLPDISGIELTEKLSELLPRIVHIVMTGHASLESAIGAVRLKSIVAYLTKPLNMDHLLALIKQVSERKQAERALIESEERYRNLVEQATDGICLIQDGLIKYANSRQAEMWGGALEDLINSSFADHFHPDDAPMVIDRYKRQMSGKQVPSVYEAALRRKNGSVLHAELNVGITNYLGKPAELVIIRDITTRKQEEEKTQIAIQRLQLATSSGSLGIWDWDIQANILEWDDRMFELYGVTRDSFSGVFETWQNGVHPEDKATAAEALEAAIRGDKEFDTEFRIVHPDGTVKWLKANAVVVRDKDGKPLRAIGLNSDITERKQAEETVRKSEERYRQLFESINDAILISSVDGRLLDCNTATLERLGYSREELLRLKIADIVPADLRGRVKGNIEKLTAGGSIVIEGVHICKDGRTVPVEVNSHAIVYEGEQAILSVTRDVTERKRMAEQLIAQDRLASIGQLVSGVAHEINNPLTSVIGFSELLLKKELPDDIKDDLKIVNDEAQRTAKIVKNLLTFARKQPETKTQLDINEVIRGVLNLRDHEQKVNNIRVDTHLASDLPKIAGSSAQLQQVFFNIVTNAEFSMIEAHQKGNLTITTERIGDVVRASFADDGPGISPGNMSKLFTPFFTTKEVGKGTGLGLSICHGIITEHGGRIYAESEPGKGATLVVELPVKQATTGQKVAE